MLIATCLLCQVLARSACGDIQLEMVFMELIFSLDLFVARQECGTVGVECGNLLRNFWSEVNMCRKHPADRGCPALF